MLLTLEQDTRGMKFHKHRSYRHLNTCVIIREEVSVSSLLDGLPNERR